MWNGIILTGRDLLNGRLHLFAGCLCGGLQYRNLLRWDGLRRNISLRLGGSNIRQVFTQSRRWPGGPNTKHS